MWSQLCIVFKKENLRVTCGDLETLVIEIDNGKGIRLCLSNLVCRSPNGSVKTFHYHLKLLSDRTTRSNKNITLVDDFNLNFLGFYHSSRVNIYISELFKNNLLKKPTRVTSKSISAIDE